MGEFDEVTERLARFYRHAGAVVDAPVPAWEPERHTRIRPGVPWRTQLLAALALLALAVGLSIMLRNARHEAPATRATPTPTPIPITKTTAELRFPPGVVYYQDPRQPGNLYMFSWTGTETAIPLSLRVALPSPPGGAVIHQAPDGSRLQLGTSVYDIQGKLLGEVPASKPSPSWGDDSRHLCTLGDPSGQAQEGTVAVLSTVEAGGVPRQVARVGVIGGQRGPGIAACSFLADQAVVVQINVSWSAEVWLVRLSTGAVLYHGTFPADQVTVFASRDGQYLAEDDYKSGTAVIRHVPDGAVVATLNNLQVQGFSWDGSLVAATSGTYPWDQDVRILNWRTGQVIWRAPADQRLGGLPLPEPAGSRLLIMLRPDATATYTDLWLVSPDGTARRMAAGVAAAFP